MAASMVSPKLILGGTILWGSFHSRLEIKTLRHWEKKAREEGGERKDYIWILGKFIWKKTDLPLFS